MNRYKRITQVTKIENIALHDYLNLHVPHQPMTANGHSFCSKCGSPIVEHSDGTWKSTSKLEEIKLCILYTKRYNKFVVHQLSNAADGTYFVALQLGMTSSENKRKACADPETAYNWAANIDGAPSKATWLGVRFHTTYSEAYKRFFKLTDETIREKKWTNLLQSADRDSLRQQAA